MASEGTIGFERLRARVDALQTTGEYNAHGRLIFKEGEGTPLAAIMQEADETILRRRVTFDTGSEQIELEIGERRFLRVVSGPDAMLADNDWHEALEASDKDAFLNWLDAFCEGVSFLAVRSEISSSRQGAVDAGIPCALLQSERGGKGGGLTFDEAVMQSLPLVRCALDPSGHRVDSGQDAAARDVLDQRDNFAGSDTADGASLTAWQVSSSAPLWLAYGQGDGKEFWCVVAQQDLAGLTAIWCGVNQ